MSEIRQVGSPSGGFVRLPNELFRTPGVKPRATHVYGHLRSHETGWNTSAAQIARETGMSNRTVLAAMEDLKELGYLRVERVPGTGGRLDSFIYHVHAHPVRKLDPAPSAESAPGTECRKCTGTPSAESAPGTECRKCTGTPSVESAPLKKTKKKTKGEETPAPGSLDELAALHAAGAPGTGRDSDRCPAHAHIAPGEPVPPCVACREVRLTNEASAAERERLERAEHLARRARLKECPFCDDFGWMLDPATGYTIGPAEKCSHPPIALEA